MALQALYAMDLIGLWERDPIEFLFEKRRWPESVSFAYTILKGVLRHKGKIDKAIQECAQHWNISRMNYLDRNILRIATFELLCCDDIPTKVCINEALDLSNRYGTPESKRFINGILDKIATTANQEQISNPESET